MTNSYQFGLMVSSRPKGSWTLGAGSASHADTATRPISVGTAKQARPPREVLR